MGNSLATVGASRDQAWEDVKRLHEDIDRLTETGVSENSRDVEVIKKVMALVSADLYYRRAESEELEGELN